MQTKRSSSSVSWDGRIVSRIPRHDHREPLPGLAHHLAHRFANRGEPYDDLYQVACMALVKAVERFDPERSVKFSSFAVPYIVGELKRHFRDKGWSGKAPRRVRSCTWKSGLR